MCYSLQKRLKCCKDLNFCNYPRYIISPSPLPSLPNWQAEIWLCAESRIGRCRVQRWNSWTAFLVEFSRHKLESSQTHVFCLVSYSHFSILQYAILEYTRVFLFRGFFERILKPEKSWFSLKSASRGDCGTEDSSLFLNWCPRIPSRDCPPSFQLTLPCNNIVWESQFHWSGNWGQAHS